MNDLRELLQAKLTIDWKDGQVLTCPSVSMKLYYRLEDLDQYLKDDEVKYLKLRNQVLVDYLNTNENGVKVTLQELEDLPVQYLKQVHYKIMMDAFGVISNPNSKSHSQPTKNNATQ